MFDILNRPDVGFAGSTQIAGFQRILDEHHKNLTRTQSYYRRQSFATASNHILVQLIEQLPILTQPLDLLRYQEHTEANMQRLAQHFQWFTPTTVGKSEPLGLFFKNQEELIIAYHQPRSLTELEGDWESWQPIRFLSHSRTTLTLPFPHRKNSVESETVSVILIDIPLFACQYARWYEQQRLEEYARTPMQFLINYPLNNALTSFHDVAFLNRFYHYLFQVPLQQETAKHPFYLNVYEEETDKFYNNLMSVYRRKKDAVSTVFNAFPAINNASLQQVIAIPPMPMTHPVWWPLTISRLWVGACCLQWNHDRNHAPDRELVNRIRYRLKTLTNYRLLSSILTPDGETWVQRQLATLETLL